jgi:hypothetical protein
MRDCRLFIAGLVLAAGLASATDAAFAGTVAGRAGTAGQVGTVNTGLGSAAPQNLNVYGAGNGLQSATDNAINLAVGSVAPVSASANNVNVQTNIDNSKTIDASSNINVTDTVNGANVAYGGTGVSVYGFQSNALGVIDGVANFNTGVSANNGPNFTAVTDALDSATFMQSQQNGN